MHPAAVWILLTLSSTAYRQPYSSEPSIRSFVAVSNEVGYRLQRAQSYQKGNQLISPYGFSKLLSVLYEGSSGHSQQEIGRLGYRALEQQGFDISESYQQLRRYLQTGYANSDFEEATVLLYPSGYSLSPQYQQLLESSYHCLVQQVDYSKGSEGAAEDVSRWVQQTRGRISHISDVDDSSGIQVLNGVYYQGSLQFQSGEEQVQQLPFYNEGETTPQSVLYYRLQSRYPYYQDQQLQAVKLPYQDEEYSLLVVLPTQQADIRQLQQQVSTSTIQRILRKSQRTQVRVSVPQFSFDYSKQLEQDVQSLGITSIFGAGADLPGLSSSSKSYYVSRIAQRAVVQLGEGRYGQQYRYGAGQSQYEYQQYQPRSRQSEYEVQYGDEEEGQYGGRYGTGEGGQYEDQQYQYEAGQGQYRPQRVRQDYGYGIGQSEYEDQPQFQYRWGQYGRRQQEQYEHLQGGQYGNKRYSYGIDQGGQYNSGYQYGDQQEYGYGLSGQSGVAEFQANRPFLFYIIHEPTGLNVLAGRVSQL